ncbi:MAG: T9SS type A sorting domain-containing protein, partial [Bacteroidota bacterium]
FVTYENIKDTTINGSIFSVIAFANDNGINSYGVNFYLKRDSTKIYCWYKGSEKLLFDYNVLKGDTVMLDICGIGFGPDNDSIVQDTFYRKRFVHGRTNWVKNALNPDDSLATYLLTSIGDVSSGMSVAFTDKIINMKSSTSYSLLNLSTVTIPESSVYFRCYTDSTHQFKIRDNKACDYKSSVGLGKLNSKCAQVNVYPNPTNGKIGIDLSETKAGKVFITINDVLGRPVYAQQHMVNDRKFKAIVDLTNEKTGVYFVRVSAADELVTVKFILNR